MLGYGFLVSMLSKLNLDCTMNKLSYLIARQ